MRKLLVLIILILVSIFVNSAFGNEYEYFTMDSYLEFNGKDSYVGKMKGIAQRSDFTVEGLIYLAGDSLSGSTGYGTFLGSSGKNRLLIHTKSGQALAQMGAGDHRSGISPGVNKWIHYAYVYDDTKKEATWYIDGKKGNTHYGEIILEDFYLGYYGSDHYWLNGSLREIRLWNRVLTQTEIQQNRYKKLSGTEDGLIGYWPINEGAGEVVYDKSNKNNDATIYGAKWVIPDSKIINVSKLISKPYSVKKLDYSELFYTRDTDTTSRLSGYAMDENGITLWRNQKDNTYHYHPVSIAQRCLSWIDDYYRTKDDIYIETAIQHADKLIALATERCEPYYLPAYYFPYTFDFPLHDIEEDTMKAPWYSGMAQGQMLSVLSRLYYFTKDERWLDAATKVFSSFMLPPNESLPWTVYVDDEGYYWISEYPLEGEPTAVLNGFIFGIFGIYDYYLFTDNPDAKKIFLAACTTIERYLENYRNEGDISFYCLKHRVKSKKYHNVHIEQLKMLSEMTGNDYFYEMSIAFKNDFSE